MKFRAWDNENNKYFEPTYNACYGALEDLIFRLDGRLALRTMEGILDQSMFPDRFVIEQYTGLKDKNGKEIYEGDIIRTHFSFGHEVNQEPFIITWNKEKAMFEGVKPETLKGKDYLDKFSFFPEQRFLYEVIGNIHENPELLEVQDV